MSRINNRQRWNQNGRIEISQPTIRTLRVMRGRRMIMKKREFNDRWRLIPRNARKIAWRIYENYGPQTANDLTVRLQGKSPATQLSVMTIFSDEGWKKET